MRALSSAVLSVLLLLTSGVPHAAAQPAEWTRPFQPFRIIGNIYWVGTWDLSTYLITTPQGHILINSGLASTVPDIAKNIEQLGFRVRDVKILAATHGHYDHAAGMAALKALTGARLLTPARDRDLFESGGATDYLWATNADMHFPPATVDGTYDDGDTIRLGNTTLVAHRHSGHTRGATSFTTTIEEGGKSYRVGIMNLPSVNPGTILTGMPAYTAVGSDYAATFAAQKALTLDVFLASHASQFGLHEKYTPGDSYNPARFVDPNGYAEAVRRLEKAYLDELTQQRRAK